MLPRFDDILTLTDRKPDWWDGNGVPRFAPFKPAMLGIYDTYAVLAEIGCQACERHFLVGEGVTRYRIFPEPAFNSLEGLVKNYHYGDPPNHVCPGGGESMNCIDLRILEAWEHQMAPSFEWVRKPEFET